MQLSIEKLTEERNKARRNLESETTETLTSQIELEKLAEEFKNAHSDRQGLCSRFYKGCFQKFAPARHGVLS